MRAGGRASRPGLCCHGQVSAWKTPHRLQKTGHSYCHCCPLIMGPETPFSSRGLSGWVGGEVSL